MGVSARRYLLVEGKEPRRISNRLAHGLIWGEDAVPEYANTRQKLLTIFLENDDGEPTGIRGAEGSIWVFDEEGRIWDGLLDAMRLVMSSLDFPDGDDDRIINIAGKLNRKRLAREYRWEPTAGDIERVLSDIWPKEGERKLGFAKGVEPVKRSVTWEAERVLDKLPGAFFGISHPLDDLSERDLASFAAEARRLADDQGGHPFLYRAMAETAERQRDIMRARRKNKGVWYARLSVTRWDKAHVGSEVHTAHERCESRKAAVEAARLLLVENAGKLDHLHTVEAELLTEIEWQVMGGDEA